MAKRVATSGHTQKARGYRSITRANYSRAERRTATKATKRQKRGNPWPTY